MLKKDRKGMALSQLLLFWDENPVVPFPTLGLLITALRIFPYLHLGNVHLGAEQFAFIHLSPQLGLGSPVAGAFMPFGALPIPEKR